jgi:glycerophosphoryl diester phosphodiesterase
MKISRRTKYLAAAALLVCVGTIGALYGYLASSQGKVAAPHMYFKNLQSAPLVIAHRGGAGLWPENTLYAFKQAQQLGVDVIEIDVRSTKDGVLVVLHDATVERTTDGKGRVGEMTLADLSKLDAGHKWSQDGGKTFPFRGKGIVVPTLQEVFSALPDMRFNIEPKQDAPAMAQQLCRLIREHRMTDKVMLGSFSSTVLEEFRSACPEVATSASTSEASKFLALHKAGLARSFSPAMQALQVPEYAGGMQVLNADFVNAAHERNLEVHAWTVNETEDMRRLLGIGLDGIMTDYPDRLMTLLGRSH